MSSDYAQYKGKTRRKTGLVRNEWYEILDQKWKAVIKIKLRTGVEVYCPVSWFSYEAKPVLKPGTEIIKRKALGFDSRVSDLGDGRTVREVFLPWLHLIITKNIQHRCTRHP